MPYTVWERNWLCTHQHCCPIFPGCLTISRLFHHSNMCSMFAHTEWSQHRNFILYKFMDCEKLLSIKLTVCMHGKTCISQHKHSCYTLFMHRLKSSTKFTTWSMNYVVFSLSSFIMISSVWKFTPNMFLARETHMHSFFNFHIPQYFLALPIFVTRFWI